MPKFLALFFRLNSAIAAVAAACVSAFMLFCAVSYIVFGEPEGRAGNATASAGLLALGVAIAAAAAAWLLHTAAARAQASPHAALARVALYGSPLFGLAFIGLLWLAGHALLRYFAFILAAVLATRLVRARRALRQSRATER